MCFILVLCFCFFSFFLPIILSYTSLLAKANGGDLGYYSSP